MYEYKVCEVYLCRGGVPGLTLALVRQQSQNAAVQSHPQLSFSDASEQEDLPFGQGIQRDRQLLTERASQVSLF
ncbi:unnamed protein product [Caenorhabditis angaria]|uniref:Uncharacterized protein n=1 Tax=Caenorhabditis angaria TaxID=860376 RepID=A0A9P1IX92_9PELO|nr:unnamed protein product [Caenorhabditis angaria]